MTHPEPQSTAPGNAGLPIGTLGRADREIGVPGEASPWHGRGYLPHFDDSRTTQHVTFHLADSLPACALERVDDLLRLLPDSQRAMERRRKLEDWMDAGHGSCILGLPSVARLVQATLLHFDAARYRLLAWTVMPNHVHVLLEPFQGWPLARTVASWKKYTASAILRLHPDYPRPVWHPEYWDRYIRNGEHLRQVIDYIENNPVKAGLCQSAADWPYGSASPGNADLPIGTLDRADQEIGVPGRTS